MIYNSKNGLIFILNRNNITSNYLALENNGHIFIKELNKYININNVHIIDNNDVFNIELFLSNEKINSIFKLFYNNLKYEMFNYDNIKDIKYVKDEDYLFNNNIKLVPYIIKKNFFDYLNTDKYEDMFQEGLFLLYKAAKKFDKNKNYNFSTFACKYINLGIRSFLFKDNKIKIPRNIYYDKNRNDNQDFKNITNFIYLNKYIQQDDKLREIGEIITDTNNDYNIINLIYDINIIINKFSNKEQLIFKLYLQGFSQREIKKKINISQSYISRIIIKIKKEIKEYMKEGN